MAQCAEWHRLTMTHMALMALVTLPREETAGHPHLQPIPSYRCFLPDLAEFTRFQPKRDPAITSRDKARFKGSHPWDRGQTRRVA